MSPSPSSKPPSKTSEPFPDPFANAPSCRIIQHEGAFFVAFQSCLFHPVYLLTGVLEPCIILIRGAFARVLVEVTRMWKQEDEYSLLAYLVEDGEVSRDVSPPVAASDRELVPLMLVEQ